MEILKTTNKPCIYMITNLVNQKRYIGQTIRFKDRMWEHENDMRSRSAINAAIHKYGTDNFKVTILEELDDKNLLNEREEYRINHFGTFGKEYNKNKGGHGRGSICRSQPVIQYSYDYKTVIRKYDSLNEAGLDMQGNYITIRCCCLNDNGHGGQTLHAYGYG